MAREGSANVIYHDDHMQLVTWEDIFMAAWTGSAGFTHVQTMFDEHERFITRHGDQRTVSFSHVQTEIFKPPDAPTRRIIDRHTVEVVARARASASVIESKGFAGAMVRTIVSGLMLLRSSQARTVVSDPREGFAYLLRHRHPDAQPIGLDALARLYNEARGRV